MLAPLLLLLVPLRGALAELLEYPAHEAQEQHGHRDRDGLRHDGRESPQEESLRREASLSGEARLVGRGPSSRQAGTIAQRWVSARLIAQGEGGSGRVFGRVACWRLSGEGMVVWQAVLWRRVTGTTSGQ